jgi:hypothetical protein
LLDNRSMCSGRRIRDPHLRLLGLLLSLLALHCRPVANPPASGRKVAPISRNAVAPPGRFGFIDTTGQLVIAPHFNEVGWFREGLVPVKIGLVWGFADRQGRIVIAPYYSRVEPFSCGRALVEVGVFWGYLDRRGKLVIPPRFEMAGSFYENRAWVQVGGRYGYVDPAGRFVVPPKYTAAGDFSEGLAFVAQDGKHGYVDTRGTLVIPPQFDSAGSFHDGRAVVQVKRRYAYIDPTGTMVTRWFAEASDFHDGRAAVRVDDGESPRLWGYIGTSGDLVIAPRFHEAHPFCEGRAWVRDDTGQGYIDSSGTLLTPHFGVGGCFFEGRAVVFDQRIRYIDPQGQIVIDNPRITMAGSFSEGLAGVEIDGTSAQPDRGYIDQTGQLVISGIPHDEALYPFSNGLVLRASYHGPTGHEQPLYGYANKQGETVIAPSYAAAASFSEGLAPVSRNGREYGYIDTHNRLRIAMRFDEAQDFSEGRAAVLVAGRWTYIDRNGDLLGPPRFDEALPFSNEMGLVRKGERWGYVNRSGELAIDTLHPEARPFHEGLAWVGPGRGFVDQRGRLVLSVNKLGLDPATPTVFAEGLAAVALQGKYGYIDKQGRMVIAPEFDAASPFAEGLGLVWKEQRCYFLDRTGRRVIDDPRFAVAESFREGLALVKLGRYGHDAYIDRTGAFAFLTPFSNAQSFSDGMAAVDTYWPVRVHDRPQP